MNRIILAALVGVLVSGPGAKAGDIMSGPLPSILLCVSPTNLNDARCFDYILGVNDAENGRVFCTPSSLNRRFLGYVVRDYLKTRTFEYRLKRNAVDLVREALSKEYPCKK